MTGITTPRRSAVFPVDSEKNEAPAGTRALAMNPVAMPAATPHAMVKAMTEIGSSS